MKKFEIKISYPQAIECKYFVLMLPDYFTEEAVYAIVRHHKKKKYNLYVREVNSSWDAGIKCSTLEELLEKIKEVRLWKRSERTIYGDPEETLLETSEFHLPQYMIIKEVSFNQNYGYSGEGLTFFRVYLQANGCPIDMSFSCILNTVGGMSTRLSKNNYCYIPGRWKFIQDEKDPTLWKSIKYEVKKTIIGKEISYIQI